MAMDRVASLEHALEVAKSITDGDPIMQKVGTALFACAVIHTFLVKKFEHLAHKYPEGSVGENFYHFLGEVEAVFGLWAALLLGFMCVKLGGGDAIAYMEAQNYTEPAFVFVIMCMAATRPVIMLATNIIKVVSKFIPLPGRMAFFVATLILGPLLGSFITEPAAMTVTALILLKYYYQKDMSSKFKYATIGLLFVNVSIGGTLTHFAAPPVLMVAGKWGWGIAHMLLNFGYKSAIAVFINTFVISLLFKKELTGAHTEEKSNDGKMDPPWWVYVIHLVFLAMVVVTAHHMAVFLGFFLFFLGFCAVTMEYQDRLKLKESLLVGFFLGGLVTLGSMQAWWLKPLLGGMNDIVLYLGAAGLTAITDNAALTYLGGLVPLSESAKYYLVAGAVAGGGLTVIANAPNPAGFGILKSSFGEDGISPVKLLLGALFPTGVALICLGLLPSLG